MVLGGIFTFPVGGMLKGLYTLIITSSNYEYQRKKGKIQLCHSCFWLEHVRTLIREQRLKHQRIRFILGLRSKMISRKWASRTAEASCKRRGTPKRSKKCFLHIGSMYAIYGNIYHQNTPNVSIYTIHGSYGLHIPYFNDMFAEALQKWMVDNGTAGTSAEVEIVWRGTSAQVFAEDILIC